MTASTRNERAVTLPQTSARPQPRTRQEASAGGLSRGALLTVLLLTSALLVGAGLWAAWPVAERLLPAGTRGPAGDSLALDGGTLTVTDVVPERLAHAPAMPGAMMPDSVPEGSRRITVEVVLSADSSGGLAYDVAKVRLAAPGIEPIGPQRQGLGAGVVPEGARLDADLVFVVPADAAGLTLTVDGAEGGLPVQVPAAEPRAGHGTGEHADQPAGGASLRGTDEPAEESPAR